MASHADASLTGPSVLSDIQDIGAVAEGSLGGSRLNRRLERCGVFVATRIFQRNWRGSFISSASWVASCTSSRMIFLVISSRWAVRAWLSSWNSG